MDALRTEFRGFTHDLGVLTTRRAELAPAFMASYKLYHRETKRTFVAFVHELDRDMPTDRSRYMKHRSYQAALYLRRLDEVPSNGHRSSTTPLELLARVIRGLLPLLHPHENAAWNAIAAASKWRPRDLERLRTRVNKVKAKAVQFPHAPRLVRVSKIPSAAPIRAGINRQERTG